MANPNDKSGKSNGNWNDTRKGGGSPAKTSQQQAQGGNAGQHAKRQQTGPSGAKSGAPGYGKSNSDSHQNAGVSQR